jgi:hypothetical protein
MMGNAIRHHFHVMISREMIESFVAADRVGGTFSEFSPVRGFDFKEGI